jgi:hypothetical protein
MMRSIALPLSAAFAALMPTMAHAGVGMSTSWENTALTEQQCLQRAEMALRSSGFTENFELVGQSVFGDTSDYTATIRCIETKKIAFFVVAGPDSDQANRLRETIINRF